MFEVIKAGLFDFVKVIVLIFILSAGVGFLRNYISEQKIKETLVIKRGLKGHFTASILGSITPFSRDSFRLFANFLDSGVPLGIAFSFLVSTPLVNEYIMILMLVFFGWKITLLYLVLGIFIGTIAGLILSKFHFEKYIFKKIKGSGINLEKKSSVESKLRKSFDEGVFVVKKIWILVLLGIILQVIITLYVSESSIENLVDYLGILGVPIAIILGTSFPGSGVAVIPITLALFEKGIPLGTALGFLIAFISLSLPKALELKKIMDVKLIILFFSIIIFSTMILSYCLNYLIH